MEFELIAAIQQ